MTDVYIELKTSWEATEYANPNDGWDRDNTRESLDGVRASVRGFSPYLNQSMIFSSPEDFKPGDIGYAVIVRYETGDTFGRDEGRSNLVDFVKDASFAYNLRNHIESLYGEYPKSKEYRFYFDGKEYYAGAWVGYFEIFESVQVFPVHIEG